MGKLADLVKYRNELTSAVNSLNLQKAITKKITLLDQVQGNNAVAYNVDHITNNYKQLILDNDSNINQLNELIELVNLDITILATTLFANRELLAYTGRIDLPFESDLRLLVKTKIKQYCDWHYPGLQINSDKKEWVDCMVTSDPLYLANSNEATAVRELTDIISEYPDQYQNRLRLYPIDGRDFSILPQEQFSVIVCWNFLDYIELKGITEYMQQMFKLLRAGGVFMFSYNNCDIVESARLAEENGMSWVSSRAIKQLCNDIGFEVITFEDHETGDAYITQISWAEIRKPGVLTTVKAHQVAGKILEK